MRLLAAHPIIHLKSVDDSYAKDFMLMICSDKGLTRIDCEQQAGREELARALPASSHHGELSLALRHFLEGLSSSACFSGKILSSQPAPTPWVVTTVKQRNTCFKESSLTSSSEYLRDGQLFWKILHGLELNLFPWILTPWSLLQFGGEGREELPGLLHCTLAFQPSNIIMRAPPPTPPPGCVSFAPLPGQAHQSPLSLCFCVLCTLTSHKEKEKAFLRVPRKRCSLVKPVLAMDRLCKHMNYFAFCSWKASPDCDVQGNPEWLAARPVSAASCFGEDADLMKSRDVALTNSGGIVTFRKANANAFLPLTPNTCSARS